MKHITLILTALTILLFAFQVIQAQTTIDLTTCEASELVAAVNTANSTSVDTINLMAGCTYSFTTASDIDSTNGDTALPRITTAVTINGHGATIERASDAPDFRLMRVTGGNLTLDNITVRGGSAAVGGGILNEGTLTVTGSLFANNSASRGGGIYNDMYSVTIANSVFSYNYADRGGGIYGRQGLLDVMDSTFSDNIAELYGGGVYDDRNEGYIRGNTFSHNTSYRDGGGMYSTTYSDRIYGNRFSGNHAVYDGGGMLLSIPYGTMSNNIFTGNSAGLDGGAISMGGSNVTLVNHLFAGNSAGRRGGTLYYTGSLGKFINITFAGNKAIGDGGALYIPGSDSKFTNVIIWGNSEPQIIGSPIFNYSIVPESYVGGSNNLSVNPLFVNPIDASFAPTSDGDYRLQRESPAINMGSNDALPLDTFDLDNDGITDEPIPYDLDNTARVKDGVVDMGAYETEPCVENITVTAGDTAGFIHAVHCANLNPDHSTINLTESVYTFTTASDIDSTNGDTALPRITTAVTINGHGATIERISDASNFRLLRVVSGGSLTLDGVTVRGGDSKGGGAVYSRQGALTIRNSSFIGNTAKEGGAVLSEAGSLSVRNSIFSDNRIPFVAGSNRNGGGAILHSAGPLELINSRFFNNEASEGGAIKGSFFDSYIANNIFSGNTAATGGALYISGYNNHFVNNAFTGNFAITDGAAFEITGSNTHFINTTISGNNGGRSIIDFGGSGNFTNSIIWGNIGDIKKSPGVVVTYSIVPEGFVGGSNNLSVDPLFANPISPDSAPTSDGDYRLQQESPAINMGDTAALPLDIFDLDGDGITDEPIPYDLDNTTRVKDGMVDMGAYERELPVIPTETPTETPTEEPTPTDTATEIPTATDTPIEEPTATEMPTDTPTATDTVTEAPTATDTPTDTPTTEPAVIELLRNPGFEDQSSVKANQAEHWNFKRVAKDRRKCNNLETGKTFSRTGDCAYLFTGSDTEKSHIIQGNSGIVLPDGIMLNASVYYRTNAATPRINVRLKVFYADAERPVVTKGKINIVSQGVFTLFALEPYAPEEGTVTNIKLQFQNRAKVGKIFLDDASLNYVQP